MSHAITVGDLLMVAGIVGGLVLAVGAVILVIIVTNPFRSGH